MKFSHKIAILLFLLSIVPLLFVSYVSYTKAIQIINKEVLTDLNNIAEHRFLAIEDYYNDVKKVVTLYSQKPDIILGASKIIYKYKQFGVNSQSYTRWQDYLDQVTNNFLKLYDFYDLFIISLDGDIVYSIKKESDFATNLYTGKYKSTQLAKSFKRSIENQKLNFSSFRLYKPSNTPASFVSIPIYKNNKMIAIFAAQINTNVFYRITQNYTGLRDSGECIIATKTKENTLILNPLRFNNKKTFQTLSFKKMQHTPMQNALKNKRGSGIFTDYRGRNILATWRYIPFFDIGMVVKIDTNEVYKPIIDLKIKIAILLLFAIAFIIYLHRIIMGIVKKSEKTLNRYEMAISGAKEGLWDWDLITNEIYFSPQWKEMLGYKEHEIENSFEAWSKIVHPDDIESVISTLEKAKTKKDDFYEHIHRLKCKNGDIVWNLDRGKIIYDEYKNAIRMVGFYTDITEQKSLELKLKESKQLFDLFMGNAPYMVSIKDENAKVIYVNKKLRNFIKTDPIGKTTNEILEPKIAKKIDELDKKAKEEGVAEEILESKRDNNIFYHRVLIFKIVHSKEKIYLGAVISDITENYVIKKELEKKEKLMLAQSRHAAMGEMIGMIAHQWRQPISIINMSVNNTLVDVELGEIDEKSLKEELHSILEQTKHLSKTIDDFRNFFKPNKEKEHFFVKEIIDEMINIVGKSLENNKIFLCIENESKTKLFTYSRELLQVLINIINNAKDAFLQNNIQNRQLKIEIKEDISYIYIYICDNAGGIPPKVLPHIFEPYFSTKKEEEGTGIGLYMSKTIINKHLHGTIEAKNFEGGACFIIKLPK